MTAAVLNGTNIAVQSGSSSQTFLTNAYPGVSINFTLSTGTADSINYVSKGISAIALGESPILSYFVSTNSSGCNGPCVFVNGGSFPSVGGNASFGPYNVVAYTNKLYAANPATTTTAGTPTPGNIGTTTNTLTGPRGAAAGVMVPIAAVVALAAMLL